MDNPISMIVIHNIKLIILQPKLVRFLYALHYHTADVVSVQNIAGIKL